MTAAEAKLVEPVWSVQERPSGRALSASDQGGHIRLVQSRAEPLDAPASPAMLPPLPDFDTSMKLVGTVAETLDRLNKRCGALEQSLAAQADQFQAKLDESRRQTREWERRAKALQSELYGCQTTVTELRIGLEGATARADDAESRLAAADQLAAESARFADGFHDAILACFESRF